MDPILEVGVHTRASLVARVREWSDDESWQEFFELYWKLIYSVAIQAGLNDSEAEEVVQATMISISKRIRDFRYDRRVGSFRQWICKQTWWKINDQLRRRKRDQQRFHNSARTADDGTRTATAVRIPDPHNTFEAFVEEDWEEAVKRIALGRVRATVKPKHYQIFDLYVIKKLPIREVASLMEVNPAQVYLVKSRISRLLRTTIKQVAAQLERLPSAAGE